MAMIPNVKLRAMGTASVIAVLVCAVVALPVRGDGVYIPEQAYKKPPAIPLQRALIVFEKNSEKLILESALDAEGQSFGWILPIPAKPTSIEKASPGMLKTLSIALQPNITHDLTEPVSGAKVWAFGALLWLLWMVISKRDNPKYHLFIVAFLTLLLRAGLMPVGRMLDEGVNVPGVRVEDAKRIGNYDVAVLTLEKAEALNEWLSANGFAKLPSGGVSIVEDYATHGWCFVAAKLVRDGKGMSVPHPIALTFPVQRPVYPMRLTALAGSNVYLELFVAAQGRASCDRLELEFAGAFRRKGSYEPLPGAEMCLQSEATGRRIGHPAIAEAVGSRCVISKFTGTLAPSQMSTDILPVLKPGDTSPFVKHYFSRRGASGAGLLLGLLVWIIGMPVTVLMSYKKFLAEGRRILLRPVLATAGFGIILWGAIYFAAPKIDTGTFKHVGGKQLSAFYSGYDELPVLVGQANPRVREMKLEDARQAFAEYIEANDVQNPVLGGPVRMEDSPGNCVLLEDARGVVYRSFDSDGFPRDTVLRELDQ